MGTTITSRDFNRDASAAKRTAQHGPVTITDHGRPSHVLMTAEKFARLAGTGEPHGRPPLEGPGPNIDLDLPGRRLEPARNVDL